MATTPRRKTPASRPGAKRPVTPAVAKVPPVQGWEYCLVELSPVPARQLHQLAEAGSVGWELVCVTPSPPQGGLALAYCKRPVAR